MNKENFGSRIRDIREYYKLNQTDFSAEIGMSQSEYSKIELGKVKPSKTVLYAITARFAVSPDWVITGHGEMLISSEDYLANGIKFLGAQNISRGLAKLLKDPEYAELQSYIAIDYLSEENLSKDLKQFLQQVLTLWHQGDERTKKTLIQLIKALPEND
jgi:transcriptional regulator with XRE-family HTH domain